MSCFEINVTVNKQAWYEQHVPNQTNSCLASLKIEIIAYYETIPAINDIPYKDSLVNMDEVFGEVLRVLWKGKQQQQLNRVYTSNKMKK